MINRTIYVIDDDPSIRAVIEKTAYNENLNCITFNKADSFLKNLNRTMGVVVIDYYLGNEGTGLDLAKKVLECNPACHIILLSSQEDYKIVVEATDKGMKYVDKNCDNWINKLFKYIYQIIDEREEYNEKRGNLFDTLYQYLNRNVAH